MWPGTSKKAHAGKWRHLFANANLSSTPGIARAQYVVGFALSA